MPLPFLTFLIIFILWMQYKFRSTDKKQKKSTQNFWEKEQQANNTRRQSLDSIHYITIPLDRLPFLDNPSDEVAASQEHIRQLAEKKIANFSGKTNTDLKLEYGAANLDELTSMDLHFAELLRTLYKWGQTLYDEGLYNEARTVLEYGVACKTDISKHYTLLAEIYKHKNMPEKIEDLVKMTENLDTLMKTSIIKSLKEVAVSCHTP